MKKIISLVLGIAMLASMSVSAFADTVIIYQDSTDKVSTIESDVKYVGPPKIVPYYLVDIYLSDNYDAEFLNDEVHITFDTYIKGSNLGLTYTAKGTSISFWGGDDPYDIDKITMKDTLAATGLTGFNGDGWDGSITTGKITFTSKIEDHWYLSHEYENIEMNGLIVYLSHTVDTTFTYGSTNKTISCSDGSSA
ncbi:hypothetical protein J2Z76_003110 [Sedimentibacter acidaminivorans]|uniref:Cohesin domain-containing protein n=1 Tax=Sedimentibacter acidaminivorans TaxID=913099 RepID=A0ABS4GHQ5_9FIRM|nr:hypothetical protein [Sedimentibacter acidaminivorans]MBP1927213.1 hypothetical protein [Sedimentibacter acidaminivorans]